MMEPVESAGVPPHSQLLKRPSPHIHDASDSRRIMLDVLTALAPAVLGSVYLFGLTVAPYYAIAVGVAVLLDWACVALVRKQPYTFDWTPVVTGVLLAMSLPANVPLWFPTLGAFVGIVIAKQAFGGTGRNFLNPAIAGRLVLRLLFVAQMTRNVWPRPGMPTAPGLDAISGATPLMLLKEAIPPDYPTLTVSFLGTVGGKIGETSALLLLLGAAYLLWRRVILWRIPVAILGTMAVIAFATGLAWGLSWDTPLFVAGHLLGGAALLGAFFMATDYASSPSTPAGQIIFGIGVGAITMAYRIFGAYSEGFTFALFIMNLFVPFLNRRTAPRVIGKS